jgi:hypothetical protein
MSLTHDDLRSTTFQVSFDFPGIFIVKSTNLLIESSVTFINIRDFIIIIGFFTTRKLFSLGNSIIKKLQIEKKTAKFLR